MPLAALASYLRPIHDIRRLRLLAAGQALAFVTVLCGALDAPFMRCSAAARVALVVSVVSMRALDSAQPHTAPQPPVPCALAGRVC